MAGRAFTRFCNQLIHSRSVSASSSRRSSLSRAVWIATFADAGTAREQRREPIDVSISNIERHRLTCRWIADSLERYGPVEPMQLGCDGTSRRRFAAAFQDHVGVTPKRFARVVRFRRALELVNSSDAPLGTIAADAGYYDQPHMNAEFRIHAGMTPQALRFPERFPNGRNLAEHFFQDGAQASA